MPIGRCPDCDSIDVEEYDCEIYDDGQGYSWSIVAPYSCNKCGCEWSETEETTIHIEIERHGKDP